MEVTLVGLQNSGKTNLVKALTSGQFVEEITPTLGFQMTKVTKGDVTITLWDLGGQPRFRCLWERYCRGCDAIVYVVDASDHKKIPEAKKEFRALLNIPLLAGIPILVVATKNEIQTAYGVDKIIEEMELKSLADQQNREVCCYSISAKKSVNIDITLNWMIRHSIKMRLKATRSTLIGLCIDLIVSKHSVTYNLESIPSELKNKIHNHKKEKDLIENILSLRRNIA